MLAVTYSNKLGEKEKSAMPILNPISVKMHADKTSIFRFERVGREIYPVILI
jgi:hypothetical protein